MLVRKTTGRRDLAQSRLAQFKQPYKQWPKVGIKVDVETDEIVL
jgi:hypothetical protein